MASRRSSRAEEEDSGDALKHLSAEELQEFREIFQLVDKVRPRRPTSSDRLARPAAWRRVQPAPYSERASSEWITCS